MRPTLFIALGVAALGLPACSGHRDQAAAASMDGGTDAASDGSAGGACAASDMSAILAATNQAQVDDTMQLRGSLADEQALHLAEKLLTDHSLVLEQLQGALRAGDIASRESSLARTIASDAQRDRAAIAGAGSGAVDAAYADREVLDHLRNLTMLDQVVAPAVAGTRLAFVANDMRELETQHLAQALALRTHLDTACDPGAGD